jgi:hypothetical protein
LARRGIKNFTACAISFTALQFWLQDSLQGSQASFTVAALEKALRLSVLLDAATNVGVLDIACCMTDPSGPWTYPWIESLALFEIMGAHYYLGSLYSLKGPLSAILSSSATGEQMRLLASFLALRLVAGAPIQSIVVGISNEWELRVGIEKTRAGSSFEMGTTNPERLKGGQSTQRPMKFITNLTLSLIIVTAFGAVAILGFVFLSTIWSTLVEVVV